MKHQTGIKILFALLTIIALAQSSIIAQTKYTADIFASYFGGSGGDWMTYVTTDNSGNIIIAGHGESTDLPVKSAFQNKSGGGFTEGFIAKFNPDLKQLIFCSYLGGSDYDEIKNVYADSDGNIFVVGLTASADFPTTANAYQKNYGGNMDAFICKISPAGQLLYSTYFGGSKYDCGMRLVAANSTTVIIAGSTKSSDLPVEPAIADTIKGGSDTFVAKLNIATNTLDFSNRFGGINDEVPFCAKTDNSNNIYICGYTYSPDFPLKTGLNSSYKGKQDGYICKFNSSGNLIYSSLIGGSEYDDLVELAVNNKNEVYFMGGSSSSGLACSANAFSSAKKGATDIILGKLNAAGDSLKYFSYFGGNGNDNLFIDTFSTGYINSYCYGKLYLMGNDKLLIAGQTNSTDFQVSSGGYSKKLGADVFVSVLNLPNKEIQYFTYMGNSSDDELEGLSVVNDSLIVISGNTGAGFQVSPGAYQTTVKGKADAFAAILKFHSTTTEVDGKPEKLPAGFKLNQNYPNPFNPSTVISYRLAASGNVKLKIYDTLGRKVRTLVDSFQSAGEHSITWNATDNSSNPVSSGIYFYKMETNGMSFQKKMILLR
jgi:hypothetical protein